MLSGPAAKAMGNLQSCFQPGAGARTPSAVGSQAAGQECAAAAPPASTPAAAPAAGGDAGAARALLQPLGLEVYEEAFELWGFSTDALLRGLTERELDEIQHASRMPILPEHRQRILAASRGAQQQAPASAPGTPRSITAVSLAGASSQSPAPAVCTPRGGTSAALASAGPSPHGVPHAQQLQLLSMPPQSHSPAAAQQPSAAAAAEPVVATGPLTINRTATLAPRLSAQPPPATRRRAASVSASMRWSELPGEIAGLSYAATAPLQQPRQHQAPADAVQAAATTPRALVAAAAPSSPSPPRACHSSDPGMQPTQQPSLGTAGNVASCVADMSGAAGPAALPPAQGRHTRSSSTRSSSTCYLQDSAAAELPQAVQMLHGRMVARQRAQSSGGSILHGLPSRTQRAAGTELSASHLAPPEPWAGSGPVLHPPRRTLSDAGSVYGASISRPGSSRPGTACAADVCSIVHLARERAAARQRLPFTAGLQQCVSLAAVDSERQQLEQLGSRCSMRSGPGSRAQSPAAAQHGGLGSVSLSPRPEQPVALGAAGRSIMASAASRQLWSAERPACLADGGAGSNSRRLQHSGRGGAAPPSPTPAATTRDGDRAMRMLQEYRSINELDAAVQARVAQLSQATGARTAAPAAAASGGTAPRAADAATRASGDQQQHAAQSTQSTAALRSSVAVRAKRVLAGLDTSAAPADSRVTVGLLGIQEALQNSYDLGLGKRGTLAAAVAASAAGASKQPDAARSCMAAGAPRGGGFGDIKQRLARGGGGEAAVAAAAAAAVSRAAVSADPDNPFLCDDVAACQDGIGSGYVNPFL